MNSNSIMSNFAPSVLALYVVNAIPILGALLFRWNALDVMMLFWMENVVIGFYNVIRMLRLEGVGAMNDVFFFIIYFGAFAFLHLLLILVIFGLLGGGSIQVSYASITDSLRNTWVGTLGFLFSHGISYLSNFIGGKEYRHITIEGLLRQPYGRTLVPHAAVLIALIFVLGAKDGAVALVLFILFKIWIDARQHKQVHGLA